MSNKEKNKSLKKLEFGTDSMLIIFIYYSILSWLCKMEFILYIWNCVVIFMLLYCQLYYIYYVIYIQTY